jgi:hypothetical protein
MPPTLRALPYTKAIYITLKKAFENGMHSMVFFPTKVLGVFFIN